MIKWLEVGSNMKRASNLYNKITKLDTIIQMTNKVCKNVRNKRIIDRFGTYKSEHIIN